MADEGTILHADADSFYASVEQRDDPSLRGRPVIVGGGVALAASYEAKAFGVRTPMSETQARRLCPQAIVVRPRMEAYSEASAAMFDVFRDTTPLVVGELTFLHALPVERLWGVGPVTARKLRARSITTVADVAELCEPALVGILGRAARRQLHALAHNRDPRRIEVGRRRHSIGARRALGRRARSPDMLDTDLIALVDRLARRLRKAHRICRTVTLRLRFDDFSRATRSHTLPEATADTIALLTAGRVLLGDAMPMIERRGITLISIALTNLFGDDAVQMALPFDTASSTAIDMTLDDVRERFGAKSVTRGVLLGRREGLQVPLLPD